jgi:DNA primase
MTYISNDVMNEIRNKTDIVDVISKYITLTKRGKIILVFVLFMMIILQVI